MRILLLTLILFSTSCSMFEHRDYEEEMVYFDQFNGPLVSPGVDFETVSGDSGRYFYSDPEVVRSRVPATAEEKENYNYSSSIKRELNSLENGLSDQEYYSYLKYKNDFQNDSERIYYLRLSTAKKRSYLESKGILEPQETSSSRYPSARRPAAIARTSYWDERNFGGETIALGMGKRDVISILGPPARMEVAGNPAYENEKWTYTKNGVTRQIFFENGQVDGWTQLD